MKDLLERYNLKEKKTLYRWKEVAKIDFSKDDRGRVAATLKEVEILDQVAEHLKKSRANLSDFVPAIATEVVETFAPQAKLLELPANPDFLSIVKAIERLAIAIESKNCLENYSNLDLASDRGWILPTSKLKALIGFSPRKESFRGNWKFIKVGKIGRETAWRIEKYDLI